MSEMCVDSRIAVLPEEPLPIGAQEEVYSAEMPAPLSSDEINRLRGADGTLNDFRERIVTLETSLSESRNKTANPYLVVIVSALAVAILGYLGWIGLTMFSHSTSIGSITASLATITSDIRDIKGGIKAVGIKRDISGPITPQVLQNISTALSAAKKERAAIPTEILQMVANRLTSDTRSDLALPAWQTVLDLVGYRSWLNEAVHNALRIELHEPGKHKITLLVNHPDDLEAPKDQLFGHAPIGEAAFASTLKLGPQIVGDEGPALIVFEGGAANLDNSLWRNIVIKNARIFYRGGSMRLENVIFVNCEFSFDRTPQAELLVKQLIQHPKITMLLG